MPERLRIAYQGEPGCYSEEAVHQFFSPDVECEPATDFAAAMRALTDGRATHAVLPVENVLAGTIHANLDLIVGAPSVEIVGEVEVDVRHCLVARTPDAQVTVARSHPMALLQCTKYLAARGIRSEMAPDTAGAARELASGGDSNVAAIASARAARCYGLHVLASGIGNSAMNYTRFWVLSTGAGAGASEPRAARGGHAKTSIAFTLENGPGKLVQALSAFAYHDIDLTKIESRHIHSLGDKFDHPAHHIARWQYIFYVDIVGHIDDAKVGLAVEALKTKTAFFRLLGSYERFDHTMMKPIAYNDAVANPLVADAHAVSTYKGVSA